MSKLTDIFTKAIRSNSLDGYIKAQEEVKDLMLEIIGEDEDIRDPADLRKNITMPIFRNSLRAEQRKRISEL